jgi:type I restriction enzyme S subunit
MAILTRELRNAVLQAAIQGKLVKQRPEEGTAEELYKQIQAEKQRLIKAGTIKKGKPLPEIIDDEKPFDIPETWRWARVGNITTLNPKNVLNDNLDVAFIPMPCVSDGFRNQHTFEVRKWQEIKKGFTHFANGDIGVAKITPCFQNRKSVIFSKLENGYGAGTTELSIVRVIENTLVRDYLLWFFKTDHFIVNGVKSFSGTAGQQRIHKDYLATCLIPLPPFTEQKRIVAKIEELMAKIDEFEIIENELEALKRAFPGEMKEALLQAAMQGSLTNADLEKWEYKTLDKSTVLYTGNSISKSIKKAKYEGVTEGYDYIGTKDVGFDHHIDYDNGVRIPYDQTGFKYAEKDATLLCIEGGSAGKKIGKLDRKVCFGNKLCAFHPVGANADYLYYFLQSPLFTKVFKEGVSGMIGGVSINKLKNMEMPIPPFEDQQRIVEKLDLFLPLCDELAELA